jgi:hypothetical protein
MSIFSSTSRRAVAGSLTPTTGPGASPACRRAADIIDRVACVLNATPQTKSSPNPARRRESPAAVAASRQGVVAGTMSSRAAAG